MTARDTIQLMKAALATLVVCFAVAAPAAAAAAPDAPADDAQAKGRAQVLLSEGTAAYGRGDYAAALDKFTAAYRIFPSPKLWFNIGQANRDLGRPVEAIAAFDRFLDDAGDAPPETLAEARRSAAELKTRLGQIQVTCPTDGAEVTVDGKQVGSAPLGQMIWTTPGRHQVAVQQPGFSPAIEDVVVTAGEVTAVELQPINLQLANRSAAGADGEPKPIYRHAWFWVAAAAIVAGAVAAAVILSAPESAGGMMSNVPATTLGAQRAF